MAYENNSGFEEERCRPLAMEGRQLLKSAGMWLLILELLEKHVPRLHLDLCPVRSGSGF